MINKKQSLCGTFKQIWMVFLIIFYKNLLWKDSKSVHDIDDNDNRNNKDNNKMNNDDDNKNDNSSNNSNRNNDSNSSENN